MKYKFNHDGQLRGRFAFEIDGIDGLRERVRELKSRSGISAGANDIEHLGAVKPDEDSTMVSAVDYAGPGWYVTQFDGSAERFDTEADALISFIEDRAEVRSI